ncbi:unnamed protein product [Oikopleura dioica]|uniref:Non-haem dioxygenase N-terminal domain-containing protein n=1 Tax=Oikopleura dioica TaxID=34765 RepID=E4XN78_OIKDI|nr:unnamed protein product [Oikopleura dioica]
MAEIADLKSFSYSTLANKENKTILGREIVNEFQKVGFLRLVDIPDFDDSELLESIKCYYERSKQEKMKFALKRFAENNKNEYRGYMPLVKNLPVFKEQTDFGNNSIAPPAENAPDYEKYIKERNNYSSEKFQKSIEMFYEIYHKCAVLILEHLAIGIDEKEDFFTRVFFEGEKDQHLS